jgi:hypothetical protein
MLKLPKHLAKGALSIRATRPFIPDASRIVHGTLSSVQQQKNDFRLYHMTFH